MKKTPKNFKLSQMTLDQIAAIEEMLPAESNTAAVERAVAHYAAWLEQRQPQVCEVCGEPLDLIDLPVRWMYRCDCG